MSSKIFSAVSQKRSAQIFNAGSVIAITVMPAFPILLLWIAFSIMVYSANIFHPNPVVREYTKFGGYRFYGLVGFILVTMNYSGLLIKLLGGGVHLLILLWIISILIVVPFGIRAIVNAEKDQWKDFSHET